MLGVLFLSFSFKSKFFEVAKQLEIYTTLYKELNMYYVNEISPAEFTNKAIKNTLKDLDPYTNYYDEQEVEEARRRWSCKKHQFALSLIIVRLILDFL